MKRRAQSLLKKIRNRLEGQTNNRGRKTIAVCAAQVPFFEGGAEAHVNALVEELRIRGYEVDLINIPFKWYPHEQLLKSIKIWQLLDLNESNGKKIDIVISTKFPSYFVEHPNKTLWLIHQYRQIYDLFHTPYSGFNPSKKKDLELRDKLIEMDNQALKTYKRIYTNSKNTANRLKKYNNIESVPLYHPPKLAGKYFTADYKDYVLSVGRLDPLKRVDLLVKSLKYCDERIKCKIAGTGPELARLQSIANEYGISGKVEFLGFVPDEELIHLYANCSIVFFAPKDEDYGYITLEAFLSKKPVVTSFDSGGPLEFVEEQKNGIVLKSLEERVIAKRLEELFFDKDKCRSFGLNGYQRVKDINWDNVINSLIKGDKR